MRFLICTVSLRGLLQPMDPWLGLSALCKSGCMDQGPVWGWDPWGWPMAHWSRRGLQFPHGEGVWRGLWPLGEVPTVNTCHFRSNTHKVTWNLRRNTSGKLSSSTLATRERCLVTTWYVRLQRSWCRFFPSSFRNFWGYKLSIAFTETVVKKCAWGCARFDINCLAISVGWKTDKFLCVFACI